jgi:uncharacterized protein (DUF58 family)
MKRERGPAAGAIDPARVRFAPDFLARLERLAARIEARGALTESGGRRRVLGHGEEFVGHRPYREGEDLRDLDWALFARLDKPFVRVRRREAGERWAILLDASASMGLGSPPKLQRAAEVAAGLACAALRAGASAALFVQRDARESFGARRVGDLAGALAFLGRVEARGSRGLAALLPAPQLARYGRVFAVGDLTDVEPGDVAALARRGREVVAVRVLAPHELEPPLGAAVEWLDLESGERLACAVDAEARAAYARELERTLGGWNDVLARARGRHLVASSAREFEDVVAAALE